MKKTIDDVLDFEHCDPYIDAVGFINEKGKVTKGNSLGYGNDHRVEFVLKNGDHISVRPDLVVFPK